MRGWLRLGTRFVEANVYALPVLGEQFDIVYTAMGSGRPRSLDRMAATVTD